MAAPQLIAGFVPGGDAGYELIVNQDIGAAAGSAGLEIGMTLTGAAIGSVIPVVGTAAGAAIGYTTAKVIRVGRGLARLWRKWRVDVPNGTATINRHGRDHFSVEVQGTGTHQVITGSSSTRIVGTADVSPGPVTATTTVRLPNAAGASRRQQELLQQGNLGPYDRVTNSCVSHVCDVLGAGGVDTPSASGSDQARYILDLLRRSE